MNSIEYFIEPYAKAALQSPLMDLFGSRSSDTTDSATHLTDIPFTSDTTDSVGSLDDSISFANIMAFDKPSVKPNDHTHSRANQLRKLNTLLVNKPKKTPAKRRRRVSKDIPARMPANPLLQLPMKPSVTIASIDTFAHYQKRKSEGDLHAPVQGTFYNKPFPDLSTLKVQLPTVSALASPPVLAPETSLGSPQLLQISPPAPAALLMKTDDYIGYEDAHLAAAAAAASIATKKSDLSAFTHTPYRHDSESSITFTDSQFTVLLESFGPVSDPLDAFTDTGNFSMSTGFGLGYVSQLDVNDDTLRFNEFIFDD